MTTKLKTPLSDDALAKLHIGERVELTGVIYTGRDAAHKRFAEAIKAGKPLPFDMNGQVIYYTGPTPERPGEVIGSAGPTTSTRMDAYLPLLLEHGLKATIGKGYRNRACIDAMVKFKGVYFVATGGAGALLARRIRKSEIVAYEDLGTEAVRRLEVADFPVVVANDIYGKDLYTEGTKKYARK